LIPAGIGGCGKRVVPLVGAPRAQGRPLACSWRQAAGAGPRSVPARAAGGTPEPGRRAAEEEIRVRSREHIAPVFRLPNGP